MHQGTVYAKNTFLCSWKSWDMLGLKPDCNIMSIILTWHSHPWAIIENFPILPNVKLQKNRDINQSLSVVGFCTVGLTREVHVWPQDVIWNKQSVWYSSVEGLSQCTDVLQWRVQVLNSIVFHNHQSGIYRANLFIFLQIRCQWSDMWCVLSGPG